ncbi:MAG TPA: TetR/AcrR family transcriptional regulator [Candidatus Binataceae bacterium]|nr:TetR/AcrR family transcriptional regulator [Candidatus Binataceae bacterium]
MKTSPRRMPRPKPLRQRARPLIQAERRELLLRSAIRVFARRGLGGAHHAEIAREAEVSVPTVFFYFPTREVLVASVLEEIARFFSTMTDRIHTSDREAPAVIADHANAFLDTIRTHPDHIRILLEWSTALREEIWPLFVQFQDRNLQVVAETIRRWRRSRGTTARIESAEEDARVVGATGYMLAQMKLAAVPQDQIDRLLQTMLRSALGEV